MLSACAYSMAKFWSIINASGMFLSDAACVEACQRVEDYLALYVWLAEDALARGVAQFKCRPKMHSFHHQGLRLLVPNSAFMRASHVVCPVSSSSPRREVCRYRNSIRDS